MPAGRLTAGASRPLDRRRPQSVIGTFPIRTGAAASIPAAGPVRAESLRVMRTRNDHVLGWFQRWAARTDASHARSSRCADGIRHVPPWAAAQHATPGGKGSTAVRFTAGTSARAQSDGVARITAMACGHRYRNRRPTPEALRWSDVDVRALRSWVTRESQGTDKVSSPAPALAIVVPPRSQDRQKRHCRCEGRPAQACPLRAQLGDERQKDGSLPRTPRVSSSGQRRGSRS
jgi:hypothetical protein